VYSIPNKSHKGRLKIGSATVQSANPTQKEIDAAAHNRIQQQTLTADIPYQLEHAELAITGDGEFFRDYDVHNVLERSGYSRKAENVKNAHSEWFEVNLELAKNAVQAVKEGRQALSTKEKTTAKSVHFAFRPNQREAIDRMMCPEKSGHISSPSIGGDKATPLIGEPLIGAPQTGCTESFIQIGSFNSESEANNCMKYIKSKFCRAHLGTLKITQHNPRKVWKNVPLQDFTSASDIDWSQSIPKIDQQLYKKYGLDKKEIEFIETHVKAMD
jgi:hypothetical protein